MPARATRRYREKAVALFATALFACLVVPAARSKPLPSGELVIRTAGRPSGQSARVKIWAGLGLGLTVEGEKVMHLWEGHFPLAFCPVTIDRSEGSLEAGDLAYPRAKELRPMVRIGKRTVVTMTYSNIDPLLARRAPVIGEADQRHRC